MPWAKKWTRLERGDRPVAERVEHADQQIDAERPEHGLDVDPVLVAGCRARSRAQVAAISSTSSRPSSPVAFAFSVGSSSDGAGATPIDDQACGDVSNRPVAAEVQSATRERERQEQDEDGAGQASSGAAATNTKVEEDEQEDEAVAAARLQASQEFPGVPSHRASILPAAADGGIIRMGRAVRVHPNRTMSRRPPGGQAARRGIRPSQKEGTSDDEAAGVP